LLKLNLREIVKITALGNDGKNSLNYQ